MKIFTLLCLLTIILPTAMFPQVKDNSWMLYDDSQVAEIKISMDENDYQYLISHPQTDSAHHCIIHFKNAFIDDTIKNAGIRIRGNTSRESRKLSFKISFDEFESGKEYYGTDKLNLNGEHNDPSISRAKICWDLFEHAGIKASRAAHAALYINDVFHGVYASIEQVDNEFLKRNYADPTGNLWKCLYPADLTYKGANPSDYYYSRNFPAYELITNEELKDYTELARLIKIINQTSSALFADSLESILIVPEFLKYQAMNILVGSWDDYWGVMNNYYLYLDPVIRKFHWIPYDYDNSFGIDWSGTDWTNANPYNRPKVVQGSRPLIEKVLKVPEYKNLFTHFMDFYRRNVVNTHSTIANIDHIKEIISPFAKNDTYRTLDYGFSYNDFLNSFQTLEKDHVKKGIKEFISQRDADLKKQLTYSAANPFVYSITHELKNDSIYVYASAFDNNGIKSMTIKYSSGTNDNLEQTMSFQPLSTGKVEDADRWIGVIPSPAEGEKIILKVEATDSAQKSFTYPRTEDVVINYIPRSTGLVINEILADNSGLTPDPSGEKDDYIELYNASDAPITLTGMYLTDKSDQRSKWQFTQENLVLNAKEFLVVWCDENHNDNQPGIHTNFKLSKEGEFIGILEADSTTWLDSLTFGNQATDVAFSRVPDGYSVWSYAAPTPGRTNIITSVNNDEIVPATFEVAVYPNPFNPYTNIKYSIPAPGNVEIAIYDILGNEVWNHNEDNVNAGSYTLKWNAENSSGISMSSGIYFCRIKSGNYVSTKKLLFLK